MNIVSGSFDIGTREGPKTVSFREHPGGDGSLRVITVSRPLNARELRMVAELLENREKQLAMDRAHGIRGLFDEGDEE